MQGIRTIIYRTTTQTLTQRRNFKNILTMVAENLTQALLTKDLEIPIILEREFSAACCIRGYHIYNWT